MLSASKRDALEPWPNSFAESVMRRNASEDLGPKRAASTTKDVCIVTNWVPSQWEGNLSWNIRILWWNLIRDLAGFVASLLAWRPSKHLWEQFIFSSIQPPCVERQSHTYSNFIMGKLFYTMGGLVQYRSQCSVTCQSYSNLNPLHHIGQNSRSDLHQAPMTMSYIVNLG